MATEAQPTVGEELAKLVTYVVQVKGIYCGTADAEGKQESGIVAWRDLTTVVVPPRTKRKTVVERAIEQAKNDIGAIEAMQPLQVRVLSPEDARPFKVSTVPRDPELRIEGA